MVQNRQYKQTPPWFAVTGAPCSGKTTLISRLADQGFLTVPETARVIMEAALEKGLTARQVRRDEQGFQLMLFQKKISIENSLPKDSIVFLDRAIPDCIAYYQQCGLPTQEIEELSINRYRAVFFLEKLPFKQDGIRIEDEIAIAKLEKLLLLAYKRAEYHVIHIPVAPIQRRLDIVLKEVRKLVR